MAMYQTTVATGVPTLRAYDQLGASGLFFEMEKFSNSFLLRNSARLALYGNKWVKDPLHQWSRQWEYPFVISQMRDYLRSTGVERPHILDAGSGVTVFPFYVADEFPESRVLCVDSDESLDSVFSAIKGEHPSVVTFQQSDIRKIPCADQSIDIVYSISVLEHMDNPTQALSEFSRILRHDGLLVLTFDISLSDNLAIINRKSARELLEVALNYFKPLNGDDPMATLDSCLENGDILTTHYIAQRDVKLLPWHISRRFKVRDFFQRGYLLSKINNLTCFCLATVKR
jgi:SAM-dependent methyltransferase